MKSPRYRICSLAGLLGLLIMIAGTVTADEDLAPPLPTEIPWRDDLDRMLERRQIRFLVVYNPILYFLDGATERGAVVEMARLFEQELNEKFQLTERPLHVVFIPVSRDRLLPALQEGLGDIAAAYLSVTPQRLEQVDFSDPLISGASEVLVLGPYGTEPETLEELSGRMVFTRSDSSYQQSLERLNRRFREQALEPVQVIPVSPVLEDMELLEMVNAGLIPAVVVDRDKAELWAKVLPDIRVQEHIVLRSGGRIAWALRKNSPQLKTAVNDFVAGHRRGTLYGNILFDRYLKHNKWVRDNLAERELAKFRTTLTQFQKYGERYSLDPLLLAAVAFEESGLDQARRSERGAVGIMQMRPETAADPQVGIPDIEKQEANIHAGTKYLRFLYERYFADQQMTELDKTLFTLAAYNAGPAKLQRLRDRAEAMGLDASRWFGHSEVAAADLGWETVRYVANVYKYYTAFRLLQDRLLADYDPQVDD
jgi:membrane-bound lytic murein transglycosylase MltF